MEKFKNSQKEQLWKSRVARAAEYPGSNRKFCQAEGVSYNTFNYWKSKFSPKSKAHGVMIQPFAKVELDRGLVVKSQRHLELPDPRWVAELILHLQRSN